MQTATSSFKFIVPENQILIDQIAAMYLAEWDIPIQVTIDRLINLPLDALPFHIVIGGKDLYLFGGPCPDFGSGNALFVHGYC